MKKNFRLVFGLFIFSFLFFLPFSSFAQTEEKVELSKEEAHRELKKFFFSLWKYELYGIKDFEKVSEYCGLGTDTARIFTLSLWAPNGRLIRVFEICSPEFSGLFDSFEYYNVYTDDGSWIDKLEFSEQNSFYVKRPVDFEGIEENLEQVINENLEIENNLDIVPVVLKNTANELRLFSYGEESFSVNVLNQNKCLVTSDKKRMTRKIYNDQLQLTKKETWDISKGFSNSKITKLEKFEYENGFTPVKNTIITDTQKTVLTFDEKGFVLNSKTFNKYVVNEKENWLLQNLTDLKYDDKGRIVEKSGVSYEYTDLGKLNNTSSVKEEFFYKIDDGQPDYNYYENNELKLKTEYSSVDDWISTMYFEKGFVVETYYKKGKKTMDMIYMNGVLRRKKLYEVDS